MSPESAGSLGETSIRRICRFGKFYGLDHCSLDNLFMELESIYPSMIYQMEQAARCVPDFAKKHMPSKKTQLEWTWPRNTRAQRGRGGR